MGCLYRLTFPNGKAYIGISNKTAEERWKAHVAHSRECSKNIRQPLHHAIKKYGLSNVVVETLVVSDDWGYLCDLEIKAIAAFNTRSPQGYNITRGGEGAVGIIPTIESRAKMSVSQKARMARERLSGVMKMRAQRGIEARKRFWEAKRINGKAPWQIRAEKGRLKNQISAEDWKKEHSRRVRERLADPAISEKVKAAARARAADPAWREKIGRTKRGTTFDMSSEWAQAIADAQKKSWADPVKRAQRIARIQATRASKKLQENNT